MPGIRQGGKHKDSIQFLILTLRGVADSWEKLTTEDQIQQIIDRSRQPGINGVVIFKHSTRCSISSMALSRMERGWKFDKEQLPLFFLDLLAFRPLSSKVSEVFDIRHESPQILLIKDGRCIYNASHSEVSPQNIGVFLGI